MRLRSNRPRLLSVMLLDGGGLGLALIRDCNGARAFDTLLRIAAARSPSCGAPCAP